MSGYFIVMAYSDIFDEGGEIVIEEGAIKNQEQGLRELVRCSQVAHNATFKLMAKGNVVVEINVGKVPIGGYIKCPPHILGKAPARS